MAFRVALGVTQPADIIVSILIIERSQTANLFEDNHVTQDHEVTTRLPVYIALSTSL